MVSPISMPLIRLESSASTLALVTIKSLLVVRSLDRTPDVSVTFTSKLRPPTAAFRLYKEFKYIILTHRYMYVMKQYTNIHSRIAGIEVYMYMYSEGWQELLSDWQFNLRPTDFQFCC